MLSIILIIVGALLLASTLVTGIGIIGIIPLAIGIIMRVKKKN